MNRRNFLGLLGATALVGTLPRLAPEVYTGWVRIYPLITGRQSSRTVEAWYQRVGDTVQIKGTIGIPTGKSRMTLPEVRYAA